MLELKRNHDFQVFMSPEDKTTSLVNPPSFNWPQAEFTQTYRLDLEILSDSPTELKDNQWTWDTVSSPFLLPFTLQIGQYRWRLTDSNGDVSNWFTFDITKKSEDYLAPTAKDIFSLCEGRDQYLMYFDEDIDSIRINSWRQFDTLNKTAALSDINAVTYPTHYRRGEEEGKRTAIDNVRRWIDRDLMALTLLYKIWGKKPNNRKETTNSKELSGADATKKKYSEKAVTLLLRLAQWSPEGPATLVRPLTWGDEVGLSLARNLFLAYHWLSPLMTESEKSFVRPMLIRIAYQMEERLEQDEFQQFPGHSHTSRLPGYLGVAAIALHKEFDKEVCERWLNYSMMIYRNVLPFYGGDDGSWAEGPFYASSYSKWHHPFFLSIERISGFSFYNHPFYKNFSKFAMDFVANDNTIHPFGDGFWCKRDGKEWPGFFSQNPLRIYADRFGDNDARMRSKTLENRISTYDLHLLDVIPTIAQISYADHGLTKVPTKPRHCENKYYGFAGIGKVTVDLSSVYYRASLFGNSSHRHADQGNIAFIVNNHNVLIPSGSYGYRFGSDHHSLWTRTTKAHNLPLIDGVGQILDDESATAKVSHQESGKNWSISQLDLSESYQDVDSFIRSIIMLDDYGIVIIDNIDLKEEKPIQWRLHSELTPSQIVTGTQLNCDLAKAINSQSTDKACRYNLTISSHEGIAPIMTHGYEEETSPNDLVISDANNDIYHLEWALPSSKQHTVVAHCVNAFDDREFNVVTNLKSDGGKQVVITFDETSIEIDA